VIQALVKLGVLPLVAICLLQISGRRYPDSDLIWTWLIRSRRLAGPACLGLLLLLPLQLATTAWALLGPEQAVITNLNRLRSLQRELKRQPNVLPSRRDLGRLLGVQEQAGVEPAISPQDRPRILASLDAARTSRPAGLRRRLLQGLQAQIPPLLRNLLQALVLLLAYTGVASLNDPSKGSLLLQLQNSWLRARDDLVSSNRQQREQAADLQRLREEQQVREALRVLRQAGETPGSRRRHRGDPPPLDPSAPSERAQSGPAEPGS